MEQYSEYKDSGVKWLGEIPRHWGVKPYRFLFYNLDYLRMPITADQRSRNNPRYDYYGASGIIDKIDYYNVDDKVLLIGEDGANLLLRNLPLVYKAEGKFWVNNHAHILKPIKDDYDFMAYVMEAADYTLFITGSAQPKLSQANLNCVKLPIPPQKEQEAIANYLDAATSKIDEAIAQQQKMIDLLNERKQIIINNAVTKGLDPNVPMKDSGVEWIGEIPRHWEIRKLKSIVSKVGSGVTPRGGGSVYVNEGIMLLRSQNVYFEGFKLNDVAYITESMDKEMSNTRVHEGDVLINITGGSIGRCCYVPKDFPRANVNQHVCIIRPHNFSTKYLYYLLRSNCCQHQVDLQQTGGNREGLTSAALKNFILPIPFEEEQGAIIEYLDNKVQKLQSLMDICSKQISLLQERKQIIINEVVTGKVKVT